MIICFNYDGTKNKEILMLVIRFFYKKSRIYLVFYFD